MVGRAEEIGEGLSLKDDDRFGSRMSGGCRRQRCIRPSCVTKVSVTLATVGGIVLPSMHGLRLPEGEETAQTYDMRYSRQLRRSATFPASPLCVDVTAVGS
jgi:hypothetical protein